MFMFYMLSYVALYVKKLLLHLKYILNMISKTIYMQNIGGHSCCNLIVANSTKLNVFSTNICFHIWQVAFDEIGGTCSNSHHKNIQSCKCLVQLKNLVASQVVKLPIFSFCMSNNGHNWLDIACGHSPLHCILPMVISQYIKHVNKASWCI